jgi:hypothetical protein
MCFGIKFLNIITLIVQLDLTFEAIFGNKMPYDQAWCLPNSLGISKLLKLYKNLKQEPNTQYKNHSNFVNQSIHDNNILLFYIVGYCPMKFLTKSGQQHTQNHSYKAPTFYDLTKY